MKKIIQILCLIGIMMFFYEAAIGQPISNEELLNEFNKSDAEKDKFENEVESIEIKLNNANISIEEEKKKKRKLENQLNDLEKEKENWEKRLKESAENRKILEFKIEQLELEIEEVKSELLEKIEKIKGLENQVIQLQNENRRLKIKIRSLESKIEELKEKLQKRDKKIAMMTWRAEVIRTKDGVHIDEDQIEIYFNGSKIDIKFPLYLDWKDAKKPVPEEQFLQMVIIKIGDQVFFNSKGYGEKPMVSTETIAIIPDFSENGYRRTFELISSDEVKNHIHLKIKLDDNDFNYFRKGKSECRIPIRAYLGIMDKETKSIKTDVIFFDGYFHVTDKGKKIKYIEN